MATARLTGPLRTRQTTLLGSRILYGQDDGYFKTHGYLTDETDSHY
jgi:hypothetical protein